MFSILNTGQLENVRLLARLKLGKPREENKGLQQFSWLVHKFLT